VRTPSLGGTETQSRFNMSSSDVPALGANSFFLANDWAFGSYRWTAFYLAGGGERGRKEREKKGGGKERKRRGKVQNVALQLGVQ
jgi:hypothetical protein